MRESHPTSGPTRYHARMDISLALMLDLGGTLVFALSGALLAVRKDFDVVGVAVLSISAGLGGGIVRDTLLGETPPRALQDERYLLTALVAALLGFFFHRTIERLTASFRLLDAVGLGFFAVAGTTLALEAGLGVVPAALLGVVTGAGGGILRDLLAGDVPLVLRSEVYALAALVGALAFAGADRLVAGPAAASLGITATFALRLVAIRFGWHAPRPRRRP
jgi:uncharacterized membrane protein YeiH